MGETKNIYSKLKEFEFTSIHLYGIFFILILGLIFRNNLFPIMVLAFLYILDIMFSFFLRLTLRPIYMAMPLGIELVTFNTVIAGLVFGPTIGILCGLLFGATYYGIVFNFNSAYQLINIPFYGLVGYLAATLTFSNVVTLGVFISVIYATITSFLIFAFMGGRLYKCAIFLISNILFNYWIFSSISKTILGIIG